MFWEIAVIASYTVGVISTYFFMVKDLEKSITNNKRQYTLLQCMAYVPAILVAALLWPFTFHIYEILKPFG